MHHIWCYIRDVFLLPVRIRKIMTLQEDIQAKMNAVGGALDNVAADVASLKQQLADALAGQDAAVVAALQPVSDQLDSLVERTQALADATPDAQGNGGDGELPPADGGDEGEGNPDTGGF